MKNNSQTSDVDLMNQLTRHNKLITEKIKNGYVPRGTTLSEAKELLELIRKRKEIREKGDE